VTTGYARTFGIRRGFTTGPSSHAGLGVGEVLLPYLLTALVAVAAQPTDKFEGRQRPRLAQILEDVTGSSWPGTALAAGAIISIFSVTVASLYGQTRIPVRDVA
jgi:hypothetical protein